METNVNHVINIDVSAAELSLDSLIAKAEKLKSILMECEHFSEVMESPELALPAAAHSALPPITYTISLGDIRQLANAPADAFTEEFLDEVRKTLVQIALIKPAAPEQPKTKPQKKNLIITPGQA